MRYIEQPMSKGVDFGLRSEGFTNFSKYTKDVLLERGISNCLSRETLCNYMKPKKLDAKKMDKNYQLPKNTLKLCICCNMVKYCSRQCLVDKSTVK